MAFGVWKSCKKIVNQNVYWSKTDEKWVKANYYYCVILETIREHVRVGKENYVTKHVINIYKNNTLRNVLSTLQCTIKSVHTTWSE